MTKIAISGSEAIKLVHLNDSTVDNHLSINAPKHYSSKMCGGSSILWLKKATKVTGYLLLVELHIKLYSCLYKPFKMYPKTAWTVSI